MPFQSTLHNHLRATITLPLNPVPSGWRMCRAEIACLHVCAWNSGERKEHVEPRQEQQERRVGSYPCSPPQNKVHSPVPVAGGRETDIIAEVPPGPHPKASPIPRTGSGDPDRKPSFCPSRLSKSARVFREGGRTREDGRDFQSPSLLHSNVRDGAPRGPPRAQPWNSNLQQPGLQTLVWWGPPEGATLITGGPENWGLPGRQQRRMPRVGRSWQPPSGLCMQVLERVGRKLQTASTWEDSWAWWGGREPQPQSQGWECSPTASRWSSQGREGWLHQQPGLQG